MKRYVICALACCFMCLFVTIGKAANADVLHDIAILSAADMEGRKTGSEGAALAADFIRDRFQQLNLKSFGDSYLQPFTFGSANKTGVNVVGYQQGCHYSDYYVVVTAHYDHLGKKGRKIYHGADDNASGVVAMLHIAQFLQTHCPSYSFIFVATDAEESGLYGSKAFLMAPQVATERIVLNLNLDMISRADSRGRLYLTGAKRFPQLVTLLDEQFPKIQFLSHHGPSRVGRNTSRHHWSDASDHGPFYRADIPYLFFGGQDHPQYHTEDDQWQRIEPEFLQMALNAIRTTVTWLDSQAPQQLKK